MIVERVVDISLIVTLFRTLNYSRGSKAWLKVVLKISSRLAGGFGKNLAARASAFCSWVVRSGRPGPP